MRNVSRHISCDSNMFCFTGKLDRLAVYLNWVRKLSNLQAVFLIWVWIAK